MIEQGILTPKLYFMDRSRTEQSYEYAFVEYIDGSDLDYLLEKEPERLPLASQSLLHSIESLHRMKSPYAGQVGNLQNESFDAAAFSLTNIHRDSAYLREFDSEYADLYRRAEEKAARIAEKLSKRTEYTFIHAELGPNHVMVSKDNRAYLIDIEGARYCDVEEETSFLNIRFGNLLPCLQDVVEEDRMTFYYIGHCFGNLRGAVELKQKGYYDMADLNGMIRFFHRQFQTI